MHARSKDARLLYSQLTAAPCCDQCAPAKMQQEQYTTSCHALGLLPMPQLFSRWQVPRSERGPASHGTPSRPEPAA